MLKKDVVLGETYLVKVSGKVVKVRLDRESPYGGWDGTNLTTKRTVRIRSAARLRSLVAPNLVERVLAAAESAPVRETVLGLMNSVAQSRCERAAAEFGLTVRFEARTSQSYGAIFNTQDPELVRKLQQKLYY